MARLLVFALALSVVLAPEAMAGKAAKPAATKKLKAKAGSTRKGRRAVPRRQARTEQRRLQGLHRKTRARHRSTDRKRAQRKARGIGKGLVFKGKSLRRDVDLVIFDLDGTIADTRVDIAANFKNAFVALGVKVSDSRLLELVDGSPLAKTYWTVRPKGSEAELKKFLNAFEASQVRRPPKGTPYQGIPQLLKALSKQPGIKLAIATARPPDNAEHLLRNMGLNGHFDLITGTHGTGMPHKPAPDLLLYVAERLGISPGRTVFVGDTYTDIRAGKSAGMATVALTYGMGITQRLLAQKPDHSTGSANTLFGMFSLDRKSGRSVETASRRPPRLPRRTNVHRAEFTAL